MAEESQVVESDEEQNAPELTESEQPNKDTQVAEEAKEQPKPETESEPEKNVKKPKRDWKALLHNKKIAFPAGIFALLILLFALPVTRYSLIGIFMKKDVMLYTVDSKSKTAVFNTTVTIDGKKPGCGANKSPYPNCFAKISVGSHKIKVEAAYYQAVEKTVTIGIGKSKNRNIEVPMTSTGRVVSLRVTNKINGKALAGLHVKAGESIGTTNEKGDGQVVVSPSVDSVEIEISGDGYNTLKTTFKVSASEANFNPVSVVPAGKLYFLSKLSGKIDVVKTDLDGSNRQTVLAGTGKEQDTDTILLASRDWKYLALKSKRDSTSAKVYLIETATDTLTTIDEGNAEFSLSGWSNDQFVFSVVRNTVQLWQPKREALKSYNATTKKLTTLDETSEDGPDQFDYANESLGSVYILDNLIIYTKEWSSYHYGLVSRIADKQAKIISVKPDGSSKTTIKAIGVPSGTTTGSLSFESKTYEAQSIYFKFSVGKTSYYTYEDGQLKDNTTLTDDTYYSSSYNTYLVSPSGKQTFWYDKRDGKNSLFVGDTKGENGKQIASLSDLVPYGWYTDDYILVSKNSSELYIMATDGSTATGKPIKVTDYHKPSYDFRGYGYGYGGF